MGEVTPTLTKKESVRIVEWVEYLLDELGEVDMRALYQLHVLVKKLDDEALRGLLDKTDEIEKSGGMLTADKSRRRSKGGVFLQLTKRMYGIPHRQPKNTVLPLKRKSKPVKTGIQKQTNHT